MEFLEKVSLRDCNTLALPAVAEYLCTVTTGDELDAARRFARSRRLPVTILGGGSNVVLAGDIGGLVVRNGLPGIQGVAQQGGEVVVRVGAGENWHRLVRHCLDQGWFGLENLALIPGSAGAAPIQNIGAYGVELAQRFVSLEALVLDSGEVVELDRDDCRFGYRDSIFKGELRGRAVITAVTLALSTAASPCLEYPELRDAVAHLAAPTPRDVCEAVCALRRHKLPDPAERPNAGSFFKNPVIAAADAEALRCSYPDLPGYPQADGRVKLPAAWLIDRAGWKGRRRGPVGVHDRQALVLVHFGGGRGEQLLQLAADIAADIHDRFGVALEFEPAVLGRPLAESGDVAVRH
ncbi:MAG: UDP-N-acetylmuramate dehydrogenase [Porticoccaceae bacterium]